MFHTVLKSCLICHNIKAAVILCLRIFVMQITSKLRTDKHNKVQRISFIDIIKCISSYVFKEIFAEAKVIYFAKFKNYFN